MDNMTSGGRHISQTEAKHRLGEIIKRVAYGGERIILEFRGKPQAAIISIADLQALESRETAGQGLRIAETQLMYRPAARTRLDEIRSMPQPERGLKALEELRALAKRVAMRGGASDVAREIEEMREERADELADLS